MIKGNNNFFIINIFIDNENMISGSACDEQGRRCMCFNESSDIEVKCGCLPGYKSETEGDTSVCSGMLILNNYLIIMMIAHA